MRVGDGLIPMTWRDLRLNRAFPAPKAGTVALVGYGGGFLSLDDTDANSGDQKATIQVFYCPYSFSGGVPAKAHCIIVDPVEGISIIHGDGASFLMGKDKSIMLQSPDGQSFVKVQDGMVTIQTALLILNGGAVVVGNPMGPIAPLLAGPASPPCPRLFVNPAT